MTVHNNFDSTTLSVISDEKFAKYFSIIFSFHFVHIAWHLRLRQYYPGQEVINEHNDPNLAETPHYKEKQTILPHPISVEHSDGKKPHTPVKRTHDGKIKKDKKDPLKSPMITEQSSPKEVSIKADEAKIDMRKLVIEHKSHKKSSSSSSSRSEKIKHSSSSSSPSSTLSPKSCKTNKKQKDKNKSSNSSSSSSSDLHRSHSSSKKSSHSDKHRRDENRKSSSSASSSSSSNHSSSIEKQKSTTEISTKKIDESREQLSSNARPSEIAPQNEGTNSNDQGQSPSPIQVSSSHSNTSATPTILTPLALAATAPSTTPAPQTSTSVVHLNIPPQVTQATPCNPDQPVHPIQPPLPTTVPPTPPPPPPLDDEHQSSSEIMPDSSTPQQSPVQPAVKIRKPNNATEKNSDILGSIMACMDSPRNPSNF